MLKVLSIIGTRPEVIKMAPIIKEMQKFTDDIVAKVCITAQHREILDQALNLFGIAPDYDLNLMRQNQSTTQVASLVLAELEPILQREKADWVLLQGDTTTVMAASLAAYYAKVKIAHVEAGLRTFDKWQPFPEEINRRVVGVIADLHFAPTQQSRHNLLREGVPDERVLVTGNSVIDALRWAAEQPFDFNLPNLNLNENCRLILVTSHRRENIGQPIRNICSALRTLAERHQSDVQIVFPIHPNPNIQQPVRQTLENIPNIALLPPLDYLSLVQLMKRAYLVLTDSGGIQEEAPGLGKPVLVLRNLTERPEAVRTGTVRLVGTDSETILVEVERLLEDSKEYTRMAQAVNPYGDGFAAQRIVAALRHSSFV